MQATTQCAERISAAYPTAVRVLKLTNAICSERFDGEYSLAAARWAERPEDPMFDMQMTAVGAAALNVAERAAAGAAGHLVQDSLTTGMCACAAHRDGRHFVPLIGVFLHRLMQRLVAAGLPSV